MIALVRIALTRPYTFVVLALLILIIGPLAALRTPTDIFPDIRIPVISVVWQYTGLPPDQMSGRITTPFQRALTTTVNDIEHIEANSYNGFGIIKIFFQPNVDIRTANAQVTAISQTLIKAMPPGATPPLILNYNASTVPIVLVALSGEGFTEQRLADIGINQVRTPLVTVPGAAIPYPFGGKLRQIQIDLDPAALQARGLSGQDVANALAAQNLITPAGSEKIGAYEYAVQLNDAPSQLDELGDLPIKTVDGAMVYVRDVAQVRDGNAPQTNIVHVDGNRSVLLQVFKNGSASTLAIIAGVKQRLIDLKDALPPGLKVALLGDQSLFVRGAISSVAREGVIAAALTSLMILLFLGSWRSTLIIATSIPLAVLGSIIALSAIGETLNIMTLGGLALAVGILVDDATVTIENINWHLEHGKQVEPACGELFHSPRVRSWNSRTRAVPSCGAVAVNRTESPLRASSATASDGSEIVKIWGRPRIVNKMRLLVAMKRSIVPESVASAPEFSVLPPRNARYCANASATGAGDDELPTTTWPPAAWTSARV